MPLTHGRPATRAGRGWSAAVPRELSFRAARRLRFAVVVVIAIVGVLTIHLAFAAPASRAARPAAATSSRASGARVLLAGANLYSYDVASRRLQRLQLPPGVGAAGLRLLPLRGGTIVVGSNGRTYGATTGKPLKTLGLFADVIPDHDGDASWLLRPGSAQLAGIDGQHFGKPYVVPTGRRVVAALDAGLVLAGAAPGRPGLIDVVDPRSGRTVRSVTPFGTFLSAAGVHVAWSYCSGSGCAVQVTQLGDGQTHALPALPTGYVAIGAPALSPDNRHYAQPARQLTNASSVIDLVVGHLATSSSGRPGRVAITQLSSLDADPQYARDGTLVVDTKHGLTLQRPRSRPGSPLQGLPVFTSFAVG